VQQFAHIATEANKDRPFAARSKRIAEDIAKAADELLAEIDPMIEAKQYLPAAARLSALAQMFRGLPQEQAARQKLAGLLSDPEAHAALAAAKNESEAGAQLAAARRLRDDGKTIAAYRRFKAIALDYPSTESGQSAAQAATSYEADAAFMKSVKDDDTGNKAKPMLALADSYRSAGKRDQARKKYQEVIEQFPGTSFAQSARQALDEMK
jgi:TolA-binding protein